ncbi:MAG: ABC transporter ATP-binding protein, partial [Marinovum sp.]|nr:ABC transporter ATP-binding protein [Marinovum sp.]
SVQAEILNLLTDLRSKNELTYVMVSHDLSVIGHMCQTLAVMKDGEVVEVMDVETLRKAQAKHPYSRELLAASI